MQLYAFPNTVGFVLLLLVFGLAAGWATRHKIVWKHLLAAVLYSFVLKAVLYDGFGNYALPDLGGDFNWLGKALAVLVSIGFLWYYTKGDLASAFVTLKQSGDDKRSGFIAATIFFLLTAAYAAFYLPGTESGGFGSWGYQLTMPSIEEELRYRGILYFLLFRSLVPQSKSLGSPAFLAGLVVVLLFGFGHGFTVDRNWNIGIEFWEILYTGINGAFFTYVAVKTRSLLLPILMHSWANVSSYLL